MKVPLNWLKEYVNLPSDTKALADKLTLIGHMLDKIQQSAGDTVLDLELRGNRADCYSIVGIAREVSAAFNVKFKPPQCLKLKKLATNSALEIKTDLVKRVGMAEIKNVVIKKSPDWLVNRLTQYGIESINNIVDLTNYVMIETGEPMHAFDLDKIGKKFEIRLAKSGEEITTFLGDKIKLTKEDLIWSKGDTVLSIAGAIGEKHNSVSIETKNILIEAANYDRANIRRTVYRHKLFTDAGIRHEKDLDPNMVETAISRFMYLIKKYKWGEVGQEFYDYYPKKINRWKIMFDLSLIQEIGGLKIDPKIIKKILESLDFSPVSVIQNTITVWVPTHRTDVTLPEDVVEEILRIYGYDNIPTKTLSLEIPVNVTPNFILQENELRQMATAVGLDEAITLSFVQEKQQKINVDLTDHKSICPVLLNPPSPDTKFMRQNLLANLLTIARKIVDERGESLGLFEIGKVYHRINGKYVELRKLGIIYWQKSDNNFRNFKGILEAMFSKYNIPNVEFTSKDGVEVLSDTYSIKVGGDNIGVGGRIKDYFYAELELDSMIGKNNKYTVNLWPKYPPQIEDITLIIPSNLYVGSIIKTIYSINQRINKIQLTSIYGNAYTFRIWYQDVNKTLTDSEVEKIRKQIFSKLKDKFGVTVK